MAWRRNKEQAPASRGWKKWEQGAFGWLLRFLRHRFFEASGLALILLSGFGLFSTFIYNPENPSLNYFDGKGMKSCSGEMLCYLKYTAANMGELVQLLGLGTGAVFLAPLVLGIALLTHKSLKGLWWRGILWLTSPFLLAMGLDMMAQDKGGAAGRILTQRLAEFFPINGIFWAVGIITTALLLTLLSASLFRRSFSFLWAVVLWLTRIRSFRPRLTLPALFKKQKTTTDTGRTIERRKKKKKRVSKRAKAETQPHLNLSGSKSFDLPPLHLLSAPKENNIVIHEDALDANARLLENILLEFGVQGEIGKVRPGPVVTLYELSPAAGIRSSRIIGLADDIARSMSAISARVSTIPGKNTIGIELPNQKREGVYLRELLETQAFESSKQGLSLALGKDIGGEIVLADLGKMPHLLIAGTTGSGKSVGINTMIMSLLYRYKPEQCRMIMVDPKKLELSVYDEIPHLLAPVVTEPRKAVVALKWVVSEMEARYQRMAERNVRNIDGYNDEMESAQKEGRKLTRKVKTGIDPDSGKPIMEEREEPPVILPRIVVIIDEMADLMMVAGKDVEAAIQRLAQMARAAGIHMIMATQRPSVDVITGTIKANFPTRISFQVTSKIDSRTILGEQGAEQLLGQGDMLYMSAGSKVQRVHGAFVSDKEVETIVRFLKKQGKPSYLEGITDEEAQTRRAEEMSGGNENGNLYDQAVAIIARDRRASISYIQRKLQIGYNRAASLIEEMEAQGVVSPPNAAGKREVLVEER